MNDLITAIISALLIVIIHLFVNHKKERQVKISIALDAAVVIAYNLYLFV